MASKAQAQENHNWRFTRLGGFDQVLIETGEDIRNLPELDQKLWAALSCPATAVEFDAHTLALLDADGDGRIRVPEVLAATRWTCSLIKDPGELLSSRRTVCRSPPSTTATTKGAGCSGRRSAYWRTWARPGCRGHYRRRYRRYPPDLCRDALQRRRRGTGARRRPIRTWPRPSPRSWRASVRCRTAAGRRGSTRNCATASSRPPRIMSPGGPKPKPMLPAVAAGRAHGGGGQVFAAVREKIDDYFTRARLAAFDARAGAAQPGRGGLPGAGAQDPLGRRPRVAAFPLARRRSRTGPAAEQGPEPALVGGAGGAAAIRWSSPCWAIRASSPRRNGRTSATASRPIRPGAPSTAAPPSRYWARRASRSSSRAAPGGHRGPDRAGQGARARGQRDRLGRPAGALLPAPRHPAQQLRVVFATSTRRSDKAIFQAGTLYLDGRSCELCVRVGDSRRTARSPS